MPSRKKSHGRPAATPATPDQSYAQAAAPPPPTPPAPAVPGPASFASEEFEEAFEDVHTRFILNLPDSELGSADRIFFQLEQAYWFYDDIICDGGEDPDQPEMPRLPRFKHLKNFAHKMFSFSPLLEPMLPQFATMYAQFIKYKHKISTYGTILMNKDCTKIVLCQAYFGDSWTFPAGKVNQGETGVVAGARETYEETGFDPDCEMGLTKRIRAEAEARGEELPWSPLSPQDTLSFMDGTEKRRTCYVCRGVPGDFPFEPVARKEVKDIQWFDIDDLPKKTYAVGRFIKPLRKWIRKNASDAPTAVGGGKTGGKKSQSRKKGGRESRSKSRQGSRGKVRDENDILAVSGLALPGDDKGWTAEDMFEANRKLTGRDVDYDGNPHVFAEKGFDGIDPHAFRVVGGEFLNSGGIQSLAPAPDKSHLQPLFRQEQGSREGEGGAGEGLTPFFSEDGATPWGAVVQDAQISAADVASDSGGKDKKKKRKKKKRGNTEVELTEESKRSESSDPGKTLLNLLQGKISPSAGALGSEVDSDPKNAAATDVFMTDREITDRSQRGKLSGGEQSASATGFAEDEDATYLKEWVASLTVSPATEIFGDFRFDKEAIMRAMDAVSVTSSNLQA